jgi:protein MpaA
MVAHDYPRLVSLWRRLARQAGFSMREIARTCGYPVYGVSTAPAGTPPWGYISAGIHGDEPAGAWGLLEWAGRHAERLKRREWLLMPCLNPPGLVANSRLDSRGRDLNRSFHLGNIPLVRGWRKFVGDRRFPGPVIALHEDYDGDGIYVYYVGDNPAVARDGIAAAGRIIRPSMNPRVDRKWRQEGGIVRLPRVRRVPKGVEGGYLLLRHADSFTTFETPSEAALELRVRAHVAYLDSVTGE